MTNVSRAIKNEKGGWYYETNLRLCGAKENDSELSSLPHFKLNYQIGVSNIDHYENYKFFIHVFLK